MWKESIAAVVCALAIGTAYTGSAASDAPSQNLATNAGGCTGPRKSAPPGMLPENAGGHTVPPGFTIRIVARIPGPRELAALPDGDLLVATTGNRVYIVPNAEAGDGERTGEPQIYATLPDNRASGIAFSPERCAVYFGTTNAVFAARYDSGDLAVRDVVRIANVRTGGIPPGSDGDVHLTTSVVFTNGTIYASVGSSCNACTEIDPTRASILAMKPGGALEKRATRIRNGIALFADPQSGDLWTGDAGQDSLPFGHPYEFIDDVSVHPGVADYGWPECEENHHAYVAGATCTTTVQPRIELPAYSTVIGATFYPFAAAGAHAFPARYRGGIFATAHGSWHTGASGASAASAQVVFVPMRGDAPLRPVDWSNPSAQWEPFVEGFQLTGTARDGRPTGIAVGAAGSLFVADGNNGEIYRIRP